MPSCHHRRSQFVRSTLEMGAFTSNGLTAPRPRPLWEDRGGRVTTPVRGTETQGATVGRNHQMYEGRHVSSQRYHGRGAVSRGQLGGSPAGVDVIHWLRRGL